MGLLVVSPRRVAALKSAREKIEEATGVKVEVKDDGSVSFAGDEGAAWTALQICRAIGYGFLPKQALKLTGDDYFLEVVDLREAFKGNEKKMKRYKARVIGEKGKAKENIQELSGAWVSIFEEDVAILGKYADLQAAKTAVYKLLEGREHATVYAFLEAKRKQGELS
ncbi:RNA-processing protein [Candidatus Micrarchaeota archaeon CG_4_10_14_0_2_um_filter_60_11]|nr:MAG: hypothetical protein AUJ16_01090 [Candidatus Micrarchaeota archaeon CG1_02_60_51]PIZ90748.1 MAG: RNA-processing protein [Candidatus Micrarchaeota archaeon CG_4_10_14_0_2_um_filter_60_11]